MAELKNFIIITLDSLRYDVSQLAITPNFDRLMKKYQKSTNNWHKVFAHATYTLPAHVSMFSGGKFPCNNTDTPPFSKNYGLFNYHVNTNKGVFNLVEEDKCISCYFKKRNYRTIGLGSVGWFDDLLSSSKDFWGKYFDEFYFQENFRVKYEDSFYNQILLTKKLLRNNDQPLFYFINIGATHNPYRGEEKTIEGQVAALEYVDTNIMDLIDLFGKDTNIFVCGDHGDCFGEDGLWGHSFYHPKVMEVPACYLEI